VEVAHEALIRNWKRLRGWLNEDRGFLLWRQRMQIQVEQWEEHGCDAGYLLRGPSLAEAVGWRKERKQDLMAAEERFVGESIALREREREEEEQRRRAQALAEAEAKSAKSLRRAVLGLAAMLVLAIVASIVAGAAMRTATKSAKKANDNLEEAINFANRSSSRNDQETA
jgi:hypothetical protein